MIKTYESVRNRKRMVKRIMFTSPGTSQLEKNAQKKFGMSQNKP